MHTTIKAVSRKENKTNNNRGGELHSSAKYYEDREDSESHLPVTSKLSYDLQTELQESLGKGKTVVMISYATGRREVDAKGTGPRAINAALLALNLIKVGILMYSGLHSGPGTN